MTGTLASHLLLAALANVGFEDEAPDDREVPVAWAQRPLVLPARSQRVEFDYASTVIRRGRVREPEAYLGAGTLRGTLGFGLFQVEVEALRARFTQVLGFGLEQPRIAARLRLFEGPVQVAVGAGAEVPVSGTLGADAELRVRVGSQLARFDLAGIIQSRRLSTADGEPTVGAEAGAWIQLCPRVALGGLAELHAGIATARAIFMRAGGGLSWVVADAGTGPFGDGPARPTWELLARVLSPDVELARGPPELPRVGEAWEGALTLRLFFVDRKRGDFR